MGHVIDFDAFRAEQAREPVVLRIGGQDYDLPPSMPASIALRVIRMQRDMGADADVPAEELEGMSRSVFGDALHEKLIGEHRLELDELGELMKQVLQLYNPGGGSNPPNRAKRRGTKRRSISR